MKRKNRVKLRILALVIIYLLSLLAGTATALIFAYNGNDNNTLPSSASLKAEEYAKNGTLDNSGPLVITSILVYDRNGVCLDKLIYGLNYIDYDLLLAPLAAKATAKGSVTTIAMYENSINHSARGFVLVVGAAVPSSGEDVGEALFMVRKLAGLDSMLVFFSFCTIVFIMGCALLLIIDCKSRKTEAVQRQYISNVSHELKSPIASIKALTESLCDNMASDEETRIRYYNLILTETNNLNHTVTDMLQLSKIQSGKADFTKSDVTIDEVCDTVVKKYETLCFDMGIAFHPPKSTENIPTLFTNRDRAAQTLEILLDNAVKFVGDDGEIWVKIEAKRGRVVVCVKDNGVGISKEALPHIFERFYMVNQAHNSRGSGLGLAIAKETMENLGEKIWARSEQHKGSEFYFTITIA